MRSPASVLEAPDRRGEKSAVRLRVLHVISGLTAGGAETVLYRLVHQTPHIDHEVICLGPPEWYSEKLERLGVSVHHVDVTSIRTLLRDALQVYRLIRSSSADVVQGWMYRGNIVGGVIGRIAHKPVLWNIRCSNSDLLPLPSRALAHLGGILARWVPRFVINCSAVSRKSHAKIGYDAVEGAVIPNGYDEEQFIPDESLRMAARRALGIDEDCFLVGTIGRWNPAKGYNVLLRAIGLLRERGIPMRLVMAGIGLDGSNVELGSMVRDSGCSAIVHTLGYRPDVTDVARMLDVHVLPSLTEGFPNVVPETMLSGTPNVATDVGDAALIIGSTGWLIPPANPERLAAAIEQAYAEWANYPQRWEERRSAARRQIAERFSIRSMAESYEKVWRKVVLASKSGRQSVSQTGGGHSVMREHVEGRLRIVHIINDLGPGGAETLLYRLVSSDGSNEHTVISLGRPAWYSSPLQERGVSVHHLGMHSALDIIGGVFRLSRIIRKSGADVVQCWMYRSNVLGGLAAKAAGKPVVWGIHCSSLELLRPSSRALAHVGGVLARWTPDYIVNCSSCSAELHDKLGYSAARGGIIHNGYEPQQFFPDDVARARTRSELGFDPSTFLIGSFSRWHPQKDIPTLLGAVRLAHDAGLPIHCLLIGHELHAESAELMASIRESGCESLVTPLWVRNDVPDLARAIDLHILASRSEAFPNVIAETMLSGTPNAATEVGDAALIIGSTGWLVPKQQPDLLAGAIIEAYREYTSDGDRWQKRRIAARRRIMENFTQERMLDAYGRIWRELSCACQRTKDRSAPFVAPGASA